MTSAKHNLLEGRIFPHITRLAVPILIGDILQQLYNSVDTIIVGKYLGTEAFAAVGVAGTIMNLCIFLLNGFCLGIAALFSMLYGRRDFSSFRKEMYVALSLGSGIAIGVSALFIIFMRPISALISTPSELMDYLTTYLIIIIAGLICTYFYNLFTSVLNAVGDTRTGLYFLAVSVTLNIFLDWLFVGPLSLGISGAAIATVAAQCISAVSCFVYLRKHYPELICTKEDVGKHTELIRQTLKRGSSTALHQSSLYIGKLLVQGAVNTTGTAGIAAFTAATRIEAFTNSCGNGMCQAGTVFISQNYGARNRKRIRHGLLTTLVISLITVAILSSLMYFFARPLVLCFVDSANEAVISEACIYIKTISVLYFLSFTGFTGVSYFRGTGMNLAPVIGTTIQISIRTILSYIFIGKMGLKAVAIATLIGWGENLIYQVSVIRHSEKTRFKDWA